MTTEQASEMAAHWLGARVDSVVAVLGGATNLVFCVRAAGESYYLRRYRKLQRAAVEREHALIAHCSARVVPAPLPLAVHRSTALEAEDGTCWALFEAAVRPLACADGLGEIAENAL
jgi:Ser/Thr protein kinase RdoA (MazF antagonist)